MWALSNIVSAVSVSQSLVNSVQECLEFCLEFTMCTVVVGRQLSWPSEESGGLVFNEGGLLLLRV